MDGLTTKNTAKLKYLHLSIYWLINCSKKTWKKKYNNFFMVAGGTGITPLYQIIQYIT